MPVVKCCQLSSPYFAFSESLKLMNLRLFDNIRVLHCKQRVKERQLLCWELFHCTHSKKKKIIWKKQTIFQVNKCWAFKMVYNSTITMELKN